MDTSTLALAVATIVVVVLLKSCWDAKPERKVRPSGSCQKGTRSGMDGSVDDNQISDWGQGVKSRQLARQYNSVGRSGIDDYDTVIKYTALDPEVFESHAEYAADVGVSTRGASNLTVRSDPNDIVPWVGRRPDYHSIYPAADARTDSSEYADQMFAKTSYVL